MSPPPAQRSGAWLEPRAGEGCFLAFVPIRLPPGRSRAARLAVGTPCRVPACHRQARGEEAAIEGLLRALTVLPFWRGPTPSR